MKPEEIRVALFSGNYNYVRDGANQALNRLAGYLLRQGVHLRVYSPTVDEPAFEPTGDLVSVPSFAIPGRGEYRFAFNLSKQVREDLAAFKPDVVHVSSPDLVAVKAVNWANERGIPAVASVHTRFETYLQYYHLGFLEPVLQSWLRSLYGKCDALLVPAQSTADVLKEQRMNEAITIWARGVDRDQFNPERRDMDWRRGLGIGDDEMAIAFLGRIVMEKGLDVFAETIEVLEKKGLPHRVLVIGDGPARGWFEEHLPDNAVFVGHQEGPDLARALASSDVFLNPSITETFGNVTLEAMACQLPVVAIAATGTNSLVTPGVTGLVSPPGDIEGLAQNLADYQADPALRAAHGEAGLAKARTMDWDSINSVVVDTYKRVIAEHHG
ncbi:glycosyltransferase family 4 protein [Sphingomicrobium aestuariivivum]|uniref:glycosyltransferase family 4 protein n=1 Tax=Sphingomicrobium aestuariivivum TaxID=1582356 RepID=UPI001FD70A83|nr:glycosyltransferase family 1 protein [Sphingomicrobium aestuariivivum]MCJ8191635.1 glycosyltransferase family 1 protein [Sphingomicrobium aestuariivivum]